MDRTSVKQSLWFKSQEWTTGKQTTSASTAWIRGKSFFTPRYLQSDISEMGEIGCRHPSLQNRLQTTSAHRTRFVGVLWVFWHQASVTQLCRVTIWSSVHTFSKFCYLDVRSCRCSFRLQGSCTGTLKLGLSDPCWPY